MPSKIFVGNIKQGTTNLQLGELFKRFGPVAEADVLGVGNYGFVHMVNEHDALKAIEALNGINFNGSEINVEKSTKNTQGRGQRVAAGRGGGGGGGVRGGHPDSAFSRGGIPRRNTSKIFVGNIKTGVTDEELRSLFEPFGTVTEADVCGGFGFVHMANEAEAKQAMSELNGYSLRGGCINVEPSTKETQGRSSEASVNRAGFEAAGGRGGGAGVGAQPKRGMTAGRPNPVTDGINRSGNNAIAGSNTAATNNVGAAQQPQQQSMRFDSYAMPSSSLVGGGGGGGGIASSTSTLVQQPVYSATSVYSAPPSVFSAAPPSVFSAPSYEAFSFAPPPQQQQQQSIIGGAPSASQAPIGMGRIASGNETNHGSATRRDQLYQLYTHNAAVEQPTFARYDPFLIRKSLEVEGGAPAHHALGALTDNAYYYSPFPTTGGGDFYDTRMMQRALPTMLESGACDTNGSPLLPPGSSRLLGGLCYASPAPQSHGAIGYGRLTLPQNGPAGHHLYATFE